jgi:hypothetical protein
MSRSRKTFRIVLFIIGGFSLIAALHATAEAAAGHILVVPANDGYGFEDCLKPGAACGRIVADAWCEAHGLAASRAFGRAEDITSSTGATELPKIEPGAFVVDCGD